MSNSYTKAAFAVRMTVSDATVIDAAQRAVDILDTNSDDDELKAAYADLGPAFAAVFPPTGDNDFGSFLDIFDDSAFPYLDCEIEIGDGDDYGMCEVIFSGDQFGVGQVAQLLFLAAKSALPCGFEYAMDCDRLRLGEFGGGCVAITDAGVTFFGTSRMLDWMLERASGTADDGVNGFVLSIRDAGHGLSFWNNDTGFGRLADATLFSDTEASAFDKPIAGDKPKWLAMPAPLAA